MASFFDIIKKLGSRSNPDELVNSLPSLYGNLLPEIRTAIDIEVDSYNFSESKKDLIKQKIESSIAATFYFDGEFKTKFGNTESDSQKVELIRSYLRNYIKREINEETANIVKEVRNNLITKDSDKSKSIFSIFDPRWSKKGKPGDYSEYKNYRDNVTGYLFPAGESLTESASTTSQQKSNLDADVENFNNQNGALYTRLSSAGGFAMTRAEGYLNNDLNSNFNRMARDAQVYSSEAGAFLSLDEQIILNNIESEKGLKKNLSKSQKIELLRAIQEKDTSKASKYFDSKSLGNRSVEDVYTDLSKTRQKIKVSQETGKAQVVGKDTLKQLRSSSLTTFEKKVGKDSTNAVIDVQTSHFVSGTTTIKALMQKGGNNVAPELIRLLEKNQLALDVLNLSKILKDAAKLTGAQASQLGAIKSRVLTSISNGTLTFSSESEKNRFIQAINANDHRYLRNFVTPGLTGSGTFSKFLNNLTDESLEVAGKYGSSDLATQALNFNNQLSVYKKTVLDSYIYSAQMGFDSGYLFSEIKNRGANSYFSTKFKEVDSLMNLEVLKDKFSKNSRDRMVAFTMYMGQKFGWDLNNEGINSALDLMSGKTGFGKFLLSGNNPLLAFLKEKLGSNKNFFIVALKSIFNSSSFQKMKLELLKNLRFLGKFGNLAFKKISGPIPAVVGKLIGSSWGGVTRYLGGALNGLFRWFGTVPGATGTQAEIDFVVKAVIVFVLFPLILFYIFFNLIPNMVFYAASNSLSVQSTTFQVGAESDVIFATFQPVTTNIVLSPISASGSTCLNPSTQTYYSGMVRNDGSTVKWNNLSLSDFNGTDNSNNCKVMCNARKYLAGLSPDKDGAMNCNFNRESFPRPNNNSQYVCADLIIDSYYDDDPDMTKKGGRLVINIDKYLKETPNLYDRMDLATPNDPNDEQNLSNYQYNCIDVSNLQAGNILILRANTCNDTNVASRYITLTNEGKRASVDSGHIEMVLKVADAGANKKVLYTVNANNVSKKGVFPLTKCPTGENSYHFEPMKDRTILRGYNVTEQDEKIGSSYNGILTKGYPCRIYQMKQRASMTCPDNCNLPPSNYPDGETYQNP